MSAIRAISGIVIVLAGALGAFAIMRYAGGSRSEPDPHGHEHAHGSEAESFERGPHRGRLLRDGGFAVELAIFETGVPPELRVWLYDGEKPVEAAAARVEVELRRLGGEVQSLRFRSERDFLVGDQEVHEPHSFDVVVRAERGGKRSEWRYSTYEYRVELGPEAVRKAGIETAVAGPASLKTTLTVFGRIAPDGDRLRHVAPRFPGLVLEMRKGLGETVAADEVLAVVQSNDSLQRYEVKSPLAGTVIEKEKRPGEVVLEGERLYTVCDLSAVWVDFDVFRKDFGRIQLGQKVRVDLGGESAAIEGKISYVSPFGVESSQAITARVALANPSGELRPGLFVSGEMLLDERAVPVAVPPAAIQRLRDWEVVFRRAGSAFEARPLVLGRRCRDWVEVVRGLKAGEEYVTGGSFVIKAEIGKAAASHDH
jgi:cobalt-zinc-cadmium efflux system membrane fusion protein